MAGGKSGLAEGVTYCEKISGTGKKMDTLKPGQRPKASRDTAAGKGHKIRSND